MVPNMKPNTVSFLGGREVPRGSLDLGVCFFFCFPPKNMRSVFDIGWNMALEPDSSVFVFSLGSVAELSVLRLQTCLYFVMAENIVACT